ncbi:MAG TPA: lipid-transfer protein [Candidatus Kryptonia bacterium]|nr:lipid-transfer protein [Candidatus Kryptonia bacterium]
MSQLRNVAIVGFAQPPVVARDEHRISTEMLYPVVRQALADCGVQRDDIDYQIAGSVDYMDGRPFGFVAALDVMGSWPPRQDLHLEMDGAFCAYYAWLRMQAGDCDTALVVAHGKTSEGDPDRVMNLQLDPYYQAAIGLDPTSTAALQASAYMARTGVADADLAAIAARNRAAGACNPDNQVRRAASAAELQQSPWKVEPLRTGYLPPVGEAPTCMILAAEGKAEKLCDRPVWIQGVDHRTEMQTIGARDLSRSASTRLAAEKALAMAGLSSARNADVVELFTVTPAEELIVCEALELDARASHPVINPSGGPLCAHPIMSTGLIRLGEVFRQLSGRAGERAVADARRGIAHASQGHCLQHNLIWVLGSERRWS